MALTHFQRTIVQRIAKNRGQSGESYIARGSALNALIGAPRLSEDIDIFHDSKEAVRWAVDTDSATLRAAGYSITELIDRAYFVEVQV